MFNRKSIIVLGTSSLIFALRIASAQVDDPGRAPGGVRSGAAAADAAARGTDDARVGVSVQSTLSRELRMPSVRADVRNGVATLNGTVASEADKQRAEQLARRVEGVTRVRNALVVEGPLSAGASAGQRLEQQPRVAGPSTNAEITTRLRTDPRLAQRNIDVRTRDDVVTLTGEVESVAEKESAGRIAAEAAAGVEVRNRLSVRSQH